MKSRLASLLLVAAATGGTPATAVVYTTQSSFLAAHPTTALTSFAGMTASIEPGTMFTRIGRATLDARDPYWVSTSFWGSYDSFLDDSFSGYLTVGIRRATAVGFYYASGYRDDDSLDVTLLKGRNVVYRGVLHGGGVSTHFAYFGIDGIGPVTGIELSAARDRNAFASIAEISSNAVPEPAGWTLMVVGFAATGATLRRAARFAPAR